MFRLGPSNIIHSFSLRYGFGRITQVSFRDRGLSSVSPVRHAVGVSQMGVYFPSISIGIGGGCITIIPRP